MTQQTKIAKVLFQWEQNDAGVKKITQTDQKLIADLQAIEAKTRTTATGFEQLQAQIIATGASAKEIDQLNKSLGAGGTQAFKSQTEALAGFEAELSNIQSMEASSSSNQAAYLTRLVDGWEQQGAATRDQAVAMQKVTQEYQSQLALAQRLSQADAERASRGSDPVAALRDASFGTTSGGGNSAANTLGQFRRTLIGLPGVGPYSTPTIAVQAAETAAQKFNLSLGAVAAGGLVAGAAILGLSAASQAAAESAKKAHDEMVGASQEFLQVALNAGKFGTGDIQKQIDDQLAKLKIAEPIAQQAQRDVEQYAQHNAANTLPVVGGLFEGLHGIGGTYSGLQDRAKGAQDEVTKLQNSIASLEIQLHATSTETNNVTQAQTRQGELALTQQNAENAAQNQTADQRKQHVQNLQTEITSYQSLIDSGKLTSDQTEALSKKIEDLKAEQKGYADVTQSVADALAAAKAQQQAQLDEAHQLANIQTTTSDQRKEEVRSLAAQTAALQRYKQTAGLDQGTIDALNAEIAKNAQRIADLSAASNTYGDQLDREQKLKDALSKQTDSLLDSQQRLGDAQDALTKAENEFAAARTEHENKVDSIRSELVTKTQEADKTFATDTFKARTEAQTKLGDKLAQIETQSDRRIEEIKKRSTATIEELIAKGDQAGALRAIEQQKQQIEDEQTKRSQAEEDAKTEIAKQLKAQLETIKDHFDQQLETAKDAEKKALEQENVRWEKEKSQRQLAYDQAVRDTQNLQMAVNAIRQNMNSQGLFQDQYWADSRLSIVVTSGQKISAAFESFMNNMLATVQQRSSSTLNLGSSSSVGAQGSSFVSSSSSASSVQAALDAFRKNYYSGAASGGRTGFIPTFDTPGMNTKAGIFFSGVQEFHIPVADRRTLNQFLGNGGSSPVNFYIDARGMDAKQLAGLIGKEIDRRKPQLEQGISKNMARIYGAN